MKLSELAYQAVKNVKYVDDASFTYQSFKGGYSFGGTHSADPDYANEINNVMAPINEAIHRLSDRNKIEHEIVNVGKPSCGIIGIAQYRERHNEGDRAYFRIKKIKSAFVLGDGDYEPIRYREMGDKLLVMDDVRKSVYIQYSRDFPNFTESDVMYNDFDLVSQGISETACSYIIEYAQGKLLEPIAPELANLHITRAEQYFDDLEECSTPFAQKSVRKVYSI